MLKTLSVIMLFDDASFQSVEMTMIDVRRFSAFEQLTLILPRNIMFILYLIITHRIPSLARALGNSYLVPDRMVRSRMMNVRVMTRRNIADTELCIVSDRSTGRQRRTLRHGIANKGHGRRRAVRPRLHASYKRSPKVPPDPLGYACNLLA